jgi:hypothetical protein
VSSRVIRMPASRAASISAWPIALGSSYGVPSGPWCRVVELAHRGDAGERHLGIGRPGEPQVAVRVECCRDAIHLLAPGPECPAVGVGASPAAPGGRRGEWALAIPGSTSPGSQMSTSPDKFGFMPVKRPSVISRRTSRAIRPSSQQYAA